MSADLSDTDDSIKALSCDEDRHRPVDEGDQSHDGEKSAIEELDDGEEAVDLGIKGSDYGYIDPPEDYSMFDCSIDYGPGTNLFWNLSQFPIRDSADLVLIRRNFKLALHQMGIHGYLRICVYGGKLSHEESQLLKAHVIHLGEKEGPFSMVQMSIGSKMCVDFLLDANNWYPDRRAVVVIANQNPDFDELKRVLDILQVSYQSPALIVDPTTAQEDAAFYDSPGSVSKCTRFVSGEIYRPMIPASWRLQRQGIETGVFWDTNDCPFPADLTSDTIFHKIKSYLTKVFRAPDDLSITAYVDDEEKQSPGEFLLDQIGDLRFQFHDGVDKGARHERILHDLLLWTLGHSCGSFLFLVSGKVRKVSFGLLAYLKSIGYMVYLVTPTEEEPESQEWPDRLLWLCHDYSFEAETRSRSPEHKKIKAGD